MASAVCPSGAVASGCLTPAASCVWFLGRNSPPRAVCLCLSEPPSGSRMVVPAGSVFRGGSRGTASVNSIRVWVRFQFPWSAPEAMLSRVFTRCEQLFFGTLSRCAPAAVNLVLSSGIVGLIALDPLPLVTV